ncbi:hypothetical protein EDB83DRAFT_2520111 [Lactarius deliciosus]|nr:hypothetical protein EDB83DRAFT_2520111 [Lactarius deliciosus]
MSRGLVALAALTALRVRLSALTGLPGAGAPTTGGLAALASSARAFVDNVIVGGGTAGFVLAARLSEHERVRVGVLTNDRPYGVGLNN